MTTTRRALLGWAAGVGSGADFGFGVGRAGGFVGGVRRAVGFAGGVGVAVAVGFGTGTPAAAAPRAPTVAPRAAAAGDWPLWRAYRARFVQADGRVIDDQHATRYTTSEGQAYTLFFALVANDRPMFDTLLAWTERHLAGGDLAARLPGWRWGRHDDGRWALVDANPAADADLWLACTLFDAARLWAEPRYREIADALLRRIRTDETAELPGLGWMLLPAPAGFQLGTDRWRLNPSYLPIHQLRALDRLDPRGPWAAIATNTLAMLVAAAPRGFVPDWVNFSPAEGWHADATSPAEGSYDAIRGYLWAGLLHTDDALKAPLLRALRGPRDWLRAHPGAVLPQRVRTDTGVAVGTGLAPPAFSAALLPYLRALGEPALEAGQRARLRGLVDAAGGAAGAVPSVVHDPARPNYYDQALLLFGMGALDGRYRFAADGALQPAWARGARRA